LLAVFWVFADADLEVSPDLTPEDDTKYGLPETRDINRKGGPWQDRLQNWAKSFSF